MNIIKLFTQSKIKNINSKQQKMFSLIEDIRKKQTCKINSEGYQSFEQEVKIDGIKKLKFISYNVWFEQHNFEERNVELRNLFKKYDPDFICLQEVTQNFIRLLSQDEELCNKYHLSSPQVFNYDVLILSKYPIPFSCRYFTSEMGRNLLFGSININSVDFTICTTHLESLKQYASYRQCQLESIDSQVQSSPECILMGDLNFAKEEESKNIPKYFIDIWKNLHPNDPGNTLQESKKYPAIRFDRMLLKESQNWKPTHIEIIGKEHIPLYQNKQPIDKYEIKTPSDHFGLYAELTYINNK